MPPSVIIATIWFQRDNFVTEGLYLDLETRCIYLKWSISAEEIIKCENVKQI